MKTSIVIDITPPMPYLAKFSVMGKNAVGQSNCRIL